MRFAAALTLTHNATSLQLQGVNITTAANDRAIFMSLGSGNWALLAYKPATAQVFVTSITAGSGLSGGTITTSGTIALDVNSLTQDTDPDVGADFAPTYDVSASAHKKTLLRQFGGLVYLTSGTVSSAAQLDIVLTGYTVYRGLLVFLSSFVPVTDAVDLYLRFSTNAGSSYVTTNYNYSGREILDNTSVTTFATSGAAQIILNNPGVNYRFDNNTASGGNLAISIYDQANTAVYTKAFWDGVLFSDTSFGGHFKGGAMQETAQDTDAIRLLFSSGNIASGKWALYGYA